MIYKGEESIEYLFKSLNLSDVGESSHWEKYNKNFDYDANQILGISEQDLKAKLMDSLVQEIKLVKSY